MFTAYSNTKNKIVDVKDEYDLKEEFSCPDPNCPAKLTIRSPSGKRAKHFAQLKSKPHNSECIYASGKDQYLATRPQIRYAIEDIFSGKFEHKLSVEGKKKPSANQADLPHIRSKRIHTPRDLYEFCVVNQISTEYLDGKTVGDIVLDSRNLSKSICVGGIEGIRLVIGETVKYNTNNELVIRVQGRDSIWLTAHITMPLPLFIDLRKYLFDTYGNIKGHKIAVLGKWQKDKPYHISCVVNNQQNLIYNLRK